MSHDPVLAKAGNGRHRGTRAHCKDDRIWGQPIDDLSRRLHAKTHLDPKLFELSALPRNERREVTLGKRCGCRQPLATKLLRAFEQRHRMATPCCHERRLAARHAAAYDHHATRFAHGRQVVLILLARQRIDQASDGKPLLELAVATLQTPNATVDVAQTSLTRLVGHVGVG